ncbi:uncharacterized protein LOC125449334 isoform X3 [Stegostoma tigrinum]|uniref:uncharacterized protein LOC125449334 isoform X3 n=1 Tax=Stegostoma tigrinum TaxID=3053191 RepID=UPI00202B7D1F|nr:uncharacterized protein LOC125449334 isoform X3 [Stegostoma tigrinum]
MATSAHCRKMNDGKDLLPSMVGLLPSVSGGIETLLASQQEHSVHAQCCAVYGACAETERVMGGRVFLRSTNGAHLLGRMPNKQPNKT